MSKPLTASLRRTRPVPTAGWRAAGQTLDSPKHPLPWPCGVVQACLLTPQSPQGTSGALESCQKRETEPSGQQTSLQPQGTPGPSRGQWCGWQAAQDPAPMNKAEPAEHTGALRGQRPWGGQESLRRRSTLTQSWGTRVSRKLSSETPDQGDACAGSCGPTRWERSEEVGVSSCALWVAGLLGVKWPSPGPCRWETSLVGKQPCQQIPAKTRWGQGRWTLAGHARDCSWTGPEQNRNSQNPSQANRPPHGPRGSRAPCTGSRCSSCSLTGLCPGLQPVNAGGRVQSHPWTHAGSGESSPLTPRFRAETAGNAGCSHRAGPRQ